ncbi:MAG: tRNA (adenosine(37)-N6)-threonylcarbamoyltransferase complex dimerization subunit type 1 TsaB [Lentisphaeria bacterium]|nr:tRNA (adenosine(37)-N6)-threonylcarbamoyltransferase complex dimerization subunit type 1 TsaB [Lentisphaeria bacterium]
MIEAALDTSYGISLAVTEDGELIFEASAPFERRASDAVLVPWIEDRFMEAGIALAHVTRWTVGTGPGSFTGLRCGIAFIKGVCLQSAAVCRGIPSSLPVAARALEHHPDATDIVTLHDARRQQVITTRFLVTGECLTVQGEPTVVNARDVSAATAGATVFATAHRNEIGESLPAAVAADTVCLDHITARLLINPVGWDWPPYDALEPTLKPVYVRPAVFVEPRPLKSI